MIRDGLGTAVVGAEGRNRTADTMIFSHVLYRLSYLGTGNASRKAQNPRCTTCARSWRRIQPFTLSQKGRGLVNRTSQA